VRLQSSKGDIEVTIASLHRARGYAAAYDFTLNPAAARDLPFIFNGAAQVAGDRLPGVEAAVIESHPSIVVLSANEALSYVRYAMDRIVWMIRSLSGFTLLGGLLILALGVSSTRLRRMQEAAVFKTLGAARARLLGIAAVEFGCLGLYAGIVGLILGVAAANAALVLLFHTPPARVRWSEAALGVAAAGGASTLAGLATCLPVLRPRPLVVLRLNP